jgi:hypothetical protein
MVRCECREVDNGLNLWRGLINGLLVSIPLWVILGMVLATVLHHGPTEEAISAALMIALISEAILARTYARTLWKQVWRYANSRRPDLKNDGDKRQARPAQHAIGDDDGLHSDFKIIAGRSFKLIEDLLRYVEPISAPLRQARRAVVRVTLIRRSVALSALVGAYLQYYFLEVNLQIASLHSLTVFLPVTSIN